MYSLGHKAATGHGGDCKMYSCVHLKILSVTIITSLTLNFANITNFPSDDSRPKYSSSHICVGFISRGFLKLAMTSEMETYTRACHLISCQEDNKVVSDTGPRLRHYWSLDTWQKQHRCDVSLYQEYHPLGHPPTAISQTLALPAPSRLFAHIRNIDDN